MGKDKNKQRTKGNVKPSSSGRSAELLGGVPGFVGFGGLSDLGYVPAATQSSVEDDTQISAEFRITLRKMSKKDAVTKMKALQEFENLCNSEEIDSLNSALPYWPRLYSKLSLDCDRRVRESAQNAHLALVSQIGKSLAPYLRSVMPSWLLAMTDPHTPAAITATKCFQSAFSEEKRPGVMLFCSKEIVDYISNNLFVQSSQSLCDHESIPKEERENKFLRLLFCSLKGLSLFLETTSKLNDKKGEILAKVNSLIECEKFWKLSKHESTLVRCAWYGSIKVLFEFDVEYLRKHCEQLSKIIFSALDSQDSIVLPYIWIAFLHLCVGLPECWNHCGNSKSVFNRMYSVLRDGGRGHMTEIAPQLLPLLSVIPVSVMEDRDAFYIGFFRAISTSLRNEKVLVCRRDVAAIIVALVECLKYMSKEYGSNESLWETLMQYQVLDTLFSTFVESPPFSEIQFYQELSKLLLYWAVSTDDKGLSSNRSKIDEFWSKFLPQCEALVQEGNERKIMRLKRLFNIFEDPFSTTAKRSKGVRFEDPTPSNITPTSNDTNSVSAIQREKHKEITASYLSPLIKQCHEAYKVSRHAHIYRLFASLLVSYSSDVIFRELVELKVEDPQAAKVLFLETFILPLMEEVEGKEVPEDTSVDLFLFVYTQLNEEQRKTLLMDLKPTLRISALKLLVEKITERSEKDGVAAMWLRSPPLGSRMVKCLQQLCAIALTKGSLESPVVKEQYSSLSGLLLFIFSNGHKERTVFSIEYLSQMLKSLKAILCTLESPKEGVERCISDFLLFVAKILNSLLDSSVHSLVDGLEDILKYFYHLLWYPLPQSSSEAMAEIKSCFLKGFELNLRERMADIPETQLSDDATLLGHVLKKTKVFLLSDECTFSKILELGDMVEKILLVLFRCSPLEEECIILLDHSVMYSALQKILPSEKEWSQLEEKLSPLYVAPVVLHGTFICREFPLPSDCADTPWHQEYARVSLFIVKIIISLCGTTALSSGELTENDMDEGTVSIGQFTPLLVLALHGACHSSSLMQMNTYLGKSTISPDIKLGVDKLAKCTRKLLSMLNVGNKKLIIKHLRDRSSFGDIKWCLTLEHSLSSWVKVPICASRLIEGMDEESLGLTGTKQVLLPYLLESEMVDILLEESEKLSHLADDPFSALPSVCIITSILEHLSQAMESRHLDQKKMESVIHTVFNVLVKWRDAAANIFLFASDLSGVAWEDVSLMVSIIRLITVIVKGHSVHLLHAHWDVTLCALSAWVQSLVELSKSPESDAVVAMFTTACSKIAGVVSELLGKLMSDPSLKEDYPPTLLEEWQEFFAPSIFNTLLLRFVHCADAYHKRKSIILYSLTRSLALCVSNMETVTFKDVNLPPRFNVEDSESKFKLPDKLQFFLNHLTPLLRSPHPHCQTASFCLLKTSLSEVMEEWEKNPSSLNDSEDWPQRPLPHSLMSVIEESSVLVDDALKDDEPGCACEVPPYTDTYAYTTGYLLTWLLTLSAISCGDGNNQQLYASYIRETNNLFFTLLNTLFKLMPLKPLLDKKQSLKSDATMFNTPLVVHASASASTEFISWLSCQVYTSCLTQLPAAVRSWFTNLDRITQQIVDKYTIAHVSPVLIANEMNTIHESNTKFNNMTVKSRTGGREIVATYTIDEASMELVLRLPPNYPLSTVSLEDQKRVGVSIAQWRNWLFGLNTMLSYRNTPLLNSLEFWKKNVDQKFEGIEECYICYYVLHGTNHQIPKLLCRTCKKKFHAACLFKWFNTSNNSTCPICRSLF